MAKAKPRMNTTATKKSSRLVAMHPADDLQTLFWEMAGTLDAPTFPTEATFNAGSCESYTNVVAGVKATAKWCHENNFAILGMLFSMSNMQIMEYLREYGVECSFLLHPLHTDSKAERGGLATAYNKLKCTLRRDDFSNGKKLQRIPNLELKPTPKGKPVDFGLLEPVRFVGPKLHTRRLPNYDKAANMHLKSGVICSRKQNGKLSPVGYFTGSANWSHAAATSIETFDLYPDSFEGGRFYMDLFEHLYSFSYSMDASPMSANTPFGWRKKAVNNPMPPACNCGKTDTLSIRYYREEGRPGNQKGLYCHSCHTLNTGISWYK